MNMPSKGRHPSASHDHSEQPPVASAPDFVLYTLNRDGQRPLQFYGTVLAEVESGGSPITHRAVVYQTRGGKFISEFSSCPTRDTERTPTEEELTDCRESIIQAVIDHAEWHEGKALPVTAGGVRSAKSAETLRDLATGLDSIPLRDSRWACIWLEENRAPAAPGVASAIAQRQKKAKHELIRLYGLAWAGVGDEGLLGILTFLDRLIKVLRDAAQTEATPPSGGKAESFDTLEAALAWFKPGRLTDGLMGQLGYFKPEFVE